MDILMLSLEDVPQPFSSHGYCKLIDEYLTALRGPCTCGDKAGLTAANRATSLVASCWLTPERGLSSQFWL